MQRSKVLSLSQFHRESLYQQMDSSNDTRDKQMHYYTVYIVWSEERLLKSFKRERKVAFNLSIVDLTMFRWLSILNENFSHLSL